MNAVPFGRGKRVVGDRNAISGDPVDREIT
jgi:hypothetical protein